MFSAAPESKIVADRLLVRKQKHQLQPGGLQGSGNSSPQDGGIQRLGRRGWRGQPAALSAAAPGGALARAHFQPLPWGDQFDSPGLLPQTWRRAGRAGRGGGRGGAVGAGSALLPAL